MTPPLPTLPPPNLRLPRPRRSRIAGWLSLVVHLLMVLLVVDLTRESPFWEAPALAGVAPDSAGGGGGPGREVAMVALPATAPASPVNPPPREVPPPVPPPAITPSPVPPPAVAAVLDTLTPRVLAGNSGASGGGSGGGSGPGTGPGTGPGSGPGKGQSGGTRPPDSALAAGKDPQPRQQILPPFDYPHSMRGQTILVTFFVAGDGRVDRVVFAPEIADRGYARKLEDVMRAYRFHPARSPAGLPVPGRTTAVITF